MRKNLAVIAVIIMVCVVFCGCGKKEAEQEGKGKIQMVATTWGVGIREDGTEGMYRNAEAKEMSEPKAGDVLYDGTMGMLSIASISDKELVLNNSGFGVPDKDGNISLLQDPPKTIKIQSGETINLNTLSMDSGVEMVITYSK